MSKRAYTNIGAQDLHLHPVGGTRRDRVVVAPGETSPLVELSDRDIDFLVHKTGFLVPVDVVEDVPEQPSVQPLAAPAASPSAQVLAPAAEAPVVVVEDAAITRARASRKE